MGVSVLAPDFRRDPWWWIAAPLDDAELVPLPPRADVAIIGAGYTGLVAALTLARAGRDVVVLDALRPGEGASARNGGMIGSGHRLALETLIRKYGRARSFDTLREGLAALEFTSDLIAREGIDCNFVRCGRFHAAWRPAHYNTLTRQVEILGKEIGLEADIVPRAEQHREIGTDCYHGGVVYPRHGSLHPGLFHRGLLARARAAGAVVAGQTPVLGLERDTSAFDVVTTRGRMRARHVIVATNGYTGPVTARLRRRLIPVSSYIIATEELPAETVARLIPGGRMIVETRRLHGYYRPSPDGRRILFGGRAALRLIDERQSAIRLHRIMTALFPELAGVRVTHSWRGFVCMTLAGMPHLGLSDGVHYALGYNGSGVAMAPWLGHKIAHKLLGTALGRSAYDAIEFRAPPLYTGRPWFLPLLDAWYGARDRLGG